MSRVDEIRRQLLHDAEIREHAYADAVHEANKFARQVGRSDLAEACQWAEAKYLRGTMLWMQLSVRSFTVGILRSLKVL
jgi:hypothetical protein